MMDGSGDNVAYLPITPEGRELLRHCLPAMHKDGTFPDGAHISEIDWDKEAQWAERAHYDLHGSDGWETGTDD